MITLSERDINSLSKELSDALVLFSDEKISKAEAERIAYLTVKNIDFSNSAVAHKGVNWFAKEILRKINYNTVSI